MKISVDKILLFAVLGLVLIGVIMIASSSIVISQKNFGTNYHYFFHQIFYGVFVGLILMLIFSKINYRFWNKNSFIIFIISFCFLIAVFIPTIGIVLNDVNRWIKIGGVVFQPAEFFKIIFIIYLASLFSSKEFDAKNLLKGFFPFLILLGAVSTIFVLQPNISALGIIIFIAILMFFYAGIRMRHVLIFALLCVISLTILIKVEPYRFNRLDVFMHPELDPKGIGYQINQARLAIGSGGIFGLGIGQSRQKYNYIPEPMGDSIFAIISEEAGFLGASFLLFLFGLVAWRGLKIAKNSSGFASNFAVGMTSLILIQALMNIMALSGLMPLTGIPLPFISYGSSSIVSLLAGIGILLNISKEV